MFTEDPEKYQKWLFLQLVLIPKGFITFATLKYHINCVTMHRFQYTNCADKETCKKSRTFFFTSALLSTSQFLGILPKDNINCILSKTMCP